MLNVILAAVAFVGGLILTWEAIEFWIS